MLDQTLDARAARLNDRYKHHAATEVLRRALRDPMAVAEGRLTGAEFTRRVGMLWKVLTGGW